MLLQKEGVEAGQLLDKARIKCANVLNAHAYEIYFMSSGTESCNTSILGVYQGWVEKLGFEDAVSQQASA